MTASTADISVRVRFRDRLYPTASKIESQFGIKKDLLITQAAHESAWGESGLAKRDDNIFGMTVGTGWVEAGKPIASWPSREYSKYPPEKIRYWNKPGDIIEKMKDGKGGSILTVMIDFRVYGSWDESMLDWADHIVNSPIYHMAFLYAKEGDAGKFITAIAQAGYASDSRYASKLTGVYNDILHLPPISDPAKIV